MNKSRLKIVLKNPLKVAKLILTKDVPIFAHIYLTRRCNLHCAKCRVIERQSDELPLEEWKKIMDRMAQWGTAIVTVQGGEAMLREDIYDLLAYASKKFSVTFFTNATLLNKEKIDRLIATGINNLGMSLDSLSAAKEAKMGRGSQATQKVIETMEYLQTLKKKPKVTINSVAVKQNIDEIIELAKFVNKHDAYFSIAVLESTPGERWWFRNYAPELEFKPEDYSKVERVFNELVKLKKQGHKISNDVEQLQNAIKYIKGEYKKRCYAGKLYYSVNSDGTFMGCQDIAPIPKRVDEMKTIKEAWNYDSMVKDIKTCPGCYYGCYVSLINLTDKPWKFLFGELSY